MLELSQLRERPGVPDPNSVVGGPGDDAGALVWDRRERPDRKPAGAYGRWTTEDSFIVTIRSMKASTSWVLPTTRSFWAPNPPSTDSGT